MHNQPRRLQGGLRLGEGTVWDARRNRLLYLDIENCKVTAVEADGQNPLTLTTDGMVGCVVPMRNGNLLAAAGHSLVELDFAAQTQTVRATFSMPTYLRFNDGKCDAYGNLWVGTMAADQSHPNARGGGSLLCIRNGQIIAEYRDFSIPNGLAWSADNRTFYHIDTATQKIDAYTMETAGALHEKRAALVLPPEEGAPDGMCIDAAGNLWIALWGGGCVACYDPRTRQKKTEILVGDANASCCTFGGRELQTLYITTARDETGKDGGLYAVETSNKGNLPFLYGGMEDGT